jgi:hypothetical protein
VTGLRVPDELDEEEKDKKKLAKETNYETYGLSVSADTARWVFCLIYRVLLFLSSRFHDLHVLSICH